MHAASCCHAYALCAAAVEHFDCIGHVRTDVVRRDVHITAGGVFCNDAAALPGDLCVVCRSDREAAAPLVERIDAPVAAADVTRHIDGQGGACYLCVACEDAVVFRACNGLCVDRQGAACAVDCADAKHAAAYACTVVCICCGDGEIPGAEIVGFDAICRA